MSNPAEYERRMRADRRPLEELVSEAMNPSDENRAWEAVVALHFRGTRDVLDRAAALCRSQCLVERCLGADILGQLGLPNRTFPHECLTILLSMLECEEDTEVLKSILIAIGHLGCPEAIEPASRFRTHPAAEVRYGVVFALMGHEDQAAVAALIELTKDEDPHNRDWATFALGSQVRWDTPALRDALSERLADEDDDARWEAITGLAVRRDSRVIPAIAKELTVEEVNPAAIEAAALIADPQLHPQLLALAQRSKTDDRALMQAIQACSPAQEEH